VTAVNRGGDTDTVGAVTGAIAGARSGASELPDRWVEQLQSREDIGLPAGALATSDTAV
jgi:ADP-ribosyl-[dinitrogen reductase] hydrolase